MHITTDVQEYTDQLFKDLTLQQEEIVSKEFYDCTFVECSFTETTFQACRFVDCTFRNCDLSLVQVPDCSFTSTVFEDSKVIVTENNTEYYKPSIEIYENRLLINMLAFSDINLNTLNEFSIALYPR